MQAKIEASEISGEIGAPPSKSYAIRLILYSLIAPVRLYKIPQSQDVSAALGAVEKLGGTISDGNLSRSVSIPGNPVSLNFGGSGTTMRMILPILAYMGGEFSLDGDLTLRKRPVKELTSVLRDLGMSVSRDSLPFKMSGRINQDSVTLPGWESSQYISGFIYAMIVRGGGRIQILPPVVSRHYIEMTCSLLRSLGANIEFSENTVYVNASTMRPFSGEVPGDFLLASFYGAAAIATGGSIIIGGLPQPERWFGDHSIFEIMKQSGLKSSFEDGFWHLDSRDKGVGVDIDISQSPDMAVSLSAFAPFLDGPSIIHGVKNLRTKESDRIITISATVKAFGGHVSGTEPMVIEGPLTKRDPSVCSEQDHRIAMLASVFALARGGTVNGAECVEKSNGAFFTDLERLGGRISLSP